ncbi:hypothetical protein DFH27DRAFT_575162 [Peziza echinospora]|nr:hypothetical protein DFH27DRAFT_575162 [Peziza echinospora]
MVFVRGLELTLAGLLLAGPVSAGLYSKSSPVIQVDAKTFQKEVLDSDYTTIVEFYAPWCGHCKNLAPNYEKAATSLKGLARAVAVDCDDDINKSFCNSAGVTGFPTLKIYRPSAKKGKPSITDYNGQRSARDIVEAVVDKIPSYVTKLQDSTFNSFLETKNQSTKSILFTSKGATSPMYKALAIDFRGNVEFAQIGDKEDEAVKLFGITSFPTLVILPGGDAPGVVYDGVMKKDPISEFITKTLPKASTTDGPPAVVEEEEVKPAEPKMKIQIFIPDLIDETSMIDNCFGAVPGTCVIALVDPPTSNPLTDPTLLGLNAANEKIASTTKNYRFYRVINNTPHAQKLIDELGVDVEHPTLIAVNSARRWYKEFKGEPDVGSILGWLDAIKFGDIKKDKIPAGVLVKPSEHADEVKAEEPPLVVQQPGGDPADIPIGIVREKDELETEAEEKKEEKKKENESIHEEL